jgi:transcriptional regulator with PAS, ATPase and Fis domain
LKSPQILFHKPSKILYGRLATFPINLALFSDGQCIQGKTSNQNFMIPTNDTIKADARSWASNQPTVYKQSWPLETSPSISAPKPARQDSWQRDDETSAIGTMVMDSAPDEPPFREFPEECVPLHQGETRVFEEIVGHSPALKLVLSLLSKVAPTDSTVLITGETGTGKELIARAIHNRSTRAHGPFVKINCASIPQSLIASELFGHERGAFTGAVQRKLGRFELAQGGTLFLDEVGELPPETQVALLRVLQEREFERMGGTQAIRADVRIITATNRNLENEISAGNFRSDLFYRLNVFPIEMPSLRARKQDLTMLTEYFIRRLAEKLGKEITSISRRTLDLFRSYDWPGNIRELQNIVERALIICDTEVFSVDASWLVRLPAGHVNSTRPLPQRLSTSEKAIIESTLAQTRGQVSGAAGAAVKLGLPTSTLESKIRALCINKHFFKAA